MNNQEDTEFLRRIPKAVAPDVRFLLDGMGTSLFSMEASYKRAIETLARYDEHSIFTLDLWSRSNVFSDIWSVVDNAYASTRLLKKFCEKPAKSDIPQGVHYKEVGISNPHLTSTMNDFLDRYDSDVSGIRNMMDHLYQNKERVGKSKDALPIQGSISYILCSRENAKDAKSFIVTLVNNTFTQESCTLSLPNPADKSYIQLPVDHIVLCALNKNLKACKIDISELVDASILLRKTLNNTLETLLLSQLRRVCTENNLDFQKQLECKASGLTTVLELSFSEK
jgi:hypothetical protein